MLIIRRKFYAMARSWMFQISFNGSAKRTHRRFSFASGPAAIYIILYVAAGARWSARQQRMNGLAHKSFHAKHLKGSSVTHQKQGLINLAAFSDSLAPHSDNVRLKSLKINATRRLCFVLCIIIYAICSLLLLRRKNLDAEPERASEQHLKNRTESQQNSCCFTLKNKYHSVARGRTWKRESERDGHLICVCIINLLKRESCQF